MLDMLSVLVCCTVVVGGGGGGLFFRAEDGIRDLVRSRGLGDVYKRQVPISNVGGSAGRQKGSRIQR